MPSTYAHYVFGEMVYENISEDTRQFLKQYKDLYRIGLHGPDILFYYRALRANSVNSVGFNMHDKPAADFFENAVGMIQNQEGQLAYLLGFICHFALDSTCHGYIENKIHVSDISHTEIEVEFDRYLMVKNGLNPVTQKLTEHIRPSMENASVIAPFFPGISAGEVRKALSSMIWYNNLLVAPGEWKRRLIYGVLHLTGNYKEMHGLIVNRTANPKCEDSSLRLEKLMDKALSLALELIENYKHVLNKTEELDSRFDKTFGPGGDWRSIPVCSLKEELKYEV